MNNNRNIYALHATYFTKQWSGIGSHGTNLPTYILYYTSFKGFDIFYDHLIAKWPKYPT